MIYLFYPETRGRTLEESNLLFAAKIRCLTADEAEFRMLLEKAGGNLAVAERRLMDEVDESCE